MVRARRWRETRDESVHRPQAVGRGCGPPGGRRGAPVAVRTKATGPDGARSTHTPRAARSGLPRVAPSNPHHPAGGTPARRLARGAAPRASTCSAPGRRRGTDPLGPAAVVLADEVGLGEPSGGLSCGAPQLGLAERVLAIVPEHLAFQWLAELFHKFNALFTLLTPERIARWGRAALARSPTRSSRSGAARRPAPDAAACALNLTSWTRLPPRGRRPASGAVPRASFGLLLLTDAGAPRPARVLPAALARRARPVDVIDEFSARAEARGLADGRAHAHRGRRRGGARRVARALSRGRPLLAANWRSDRRAPPTSPTAVQPLLAPRRNRAVKVGAFTPASAPQRTSGGSKQPRSSDSARGSRAPARRCSSSGTTPAAASAAGGDRGRGARGAPLTTSRSRPSGLVARSADPDGR
jgi:ATP-dependent helicase HepA